MMVIIMNQVLSSSQNIMLYQIYQIQFWTKYLPIAKHDD